MTILIQKQYFIIGRQIYVVRLQICCFFTLLSADLHKIENGKCVILPHQFSWGRIFEVPTIQVLLDASV